MYAFVENSATDVSVGFRPPCLCPSINLDDTLLRIARELKTVET